MPKDKTIKTPVRNDTIVAGLSMGQQYHDNPKRLERQFRFLSSFNPKYIKSFLSDVAHTHTELLPSLMESTMTETEWNEQEEQKSFDTILALYKSGQTWRENMKPVYNKFQINGYDFARYVLERKEERKDDSEYSDSETTVDSGMSSSKASTPERNRSRSNSISTNIKDVDNWLHFDEDTCKLLRRAAKSRNIFIEEERSKDSLKINFEGDNNSITDIDSEDENTLGNEQEIVSSNNHNSDIVKLPVLTNEEEIRKSAYFKSIKLNMTIYYLQGRILLLEEDQGTLEHNTEKTVNFKAEITAETNHYEDIDGALEKFKKRLSETTTELERHNKFLSDNKFRDPFLKNKYKNKYKQKTFSKLIARDILNDAETFLRKKFRDDTISRYSSDWRHSRAIEISADYMILNFSVIGIYSIFDEIDYYHYPKKTTHSLITFTNKMLGELIKTLTNSSLSSDNFECMPRSSELQIQPFITEPIQIKDVLVDEINTTIKHIKEEWDKKGNEDDTYFLHNEINQNDYRQIGNALQYWINLNKEELKSLISKSLSYKEDTSESESENNAFTESLKKAKTVMTVLIHCMKLSLPKDDYDEFRFKKLLELYRKMHVLFTQVLSALNRDFKGILDVRLPDQKCVERLKDYLHVLRVKKEEIMDSEFHDHMRSCFNDSHLQNLTMTINDIEVILSKEIEKDSIKTEVSTAEVDHDMTSTTNDKSLGESKNPHDQHHGQNIDHAKDESEDPEDSSNRGASPSVRDITVFGSIYQVTGKNDSCLGTLSH